jgi:hypothetical protein
MAVMAGFDPAIQSFRNATKVVDAGDKREIHGFAFASCVLSA